ncbi:Integrase family protein (fragment) [Candidatus Sulfopaludibacter sp. SbA3]
MGRFPCSGHYSSGECWRSRLSHQVLSVLLACGLRRHEVAELSIDHLQKREGHWAIVNLSGKGGHVRTVPVPDWVYCELSVWMEAAGVKAGRLFRRVSSAGKAWGEGVTEKLAWHVVKEFATKIGATNLAPHDLRRTCARLCRAAGGELELNPVRRSCAPLT